MKTITIKQPWATLIAEGYKEYEFRTWKTKYRGPILIHAGKGIDKKAMKKFSKYNLDYPIGCILAKATLTDCVCIDEQVRNMLQEKDSFVYSSIIKHTEWNGYGFKLENVEKIKPIEVSGKLSLWEYDFKNNVNKNE